jgi:hypothetical protein
LGLLTLCIWGTWLSECYCDCGGKLKEYSASVRVCQKCKKIPNVDTILDLLRELGVKEGKLKELKKDIHFAPV